jgi:uncharacterized protein HemX
MKQRWPISAWVGLLAGVLLLAAGGAWFWQRHQQQLAHEQARREREAAELTAAV